MGWRRQKAKLPEKASLYKEKQDLDRGLLAAGRAELTVRFVAT